MYYFKMLFLGVAVSVLTFQYSFAENSKLKQNYEAKIDFEKNFKAYLSEKGHSELRRKLLESDNSLKEFILDFYSDLVMAEKAKEKGLDQSPILKKKIEFYTKKILIAALIEDAENNVVYPDSYHILAKEQYAATKKKYFINEKRKVAHILIKNKRVNPACKCEEPEEGGITIEELLDKIKKGEDFSELAKKYSDDRGSAKAGGVLEVYVDDSGVYLPSFVNGSFSIKNVGDISAPIKTRFGTHIIKLLEVVPGKYIPFEKVEDTIINSLKKSYKSSEINKIRSDSYPDLDKMDLSSLKEILKEMSDDKN